MITERFAPYDLAQLLADVLKCDVRIEERGPCAFWVYARGIVHYGQICAAVWAQESQSHVVTHSVVRLSGSNEDGEVYVGFEVQS